MLIPQQFPDGPGVSLYTLAAADYKDGCIRNTQSSLCLREEIRMPRRIYQAEECTAVAKGRLFGECSNSPVSLKNLMIQSRIAMINPSSYFQFSCLKEHCFGKGCFPRVHMGRNAQANSFFVIHASEFISFFCQSQLKFLCIPHFDVLFSDYYLF